MANAKIIFLERENNMQNTAEVIVAVSGAVRSFDTTDVLEYGVHAAVPVTAIEHGLVSDAGVTISPSSSTTTKMAWQNAIIARSLVTEGSITIQFELLQDNDDNAAWFYGVEGRNAETGGFHWSATNTGGVRQVLIDIKDKAKNKAKRYWAPEAEVTERSEIKLASGEIVGYNITLTCYAKVVEGEVANLVIWDGPAEAPVTP